jgi:small subunit ribosomal protein S5
MTFEQPQEYEERVIITHRVRKTVKGGQIPSFRAVVAVGDRKGSVGVGVGKARQTLDAIRKAGDQARKDMVVIPLSEATIYHEVEAKRGGVKVLLKPASKGTGLVAGLGVREVLEVAGVRDVLSKSIGAKNRLNRATATFEALKQLRSPEQVARLRSKSAPTVAEPAQPSAAPVPAVPADATAPSEQEPTEPVPES